MNAKIEWGRGKKVLFPTKDIGTRLVDRLGKGKYFPG